MWQDDVKVIRITTAVVGLGWAIYNGIVMAYVGAIQEFSQFVSATIALVRNKEKEVKEVIE